MPRATLMLAGFLFALWLDQRFADRRPPSLPRRVGHAAAAFLALNLSALAVTQLAAPEASPALRLALVLVLFLPCLVYACLAAVWLVRSLAEITRLYA